MQVRRTEVLPTHTEPLYRAAHPNCQGNEHVLTVYSTVFSTAQQDMGETQLLKFSLQAEPGAQAIT